MSSRELESILSYGRAAFFPNLWEKLQLLNEEAKQQHPTQVQAPHRREYPREFLNLLNPSSSPTLRKRNHFQHRPRMPPVSVNLSKTSPEMRDKNPGHSGVGRRPAMKRLKQIWKDNKLMILIIIAAILGFAFGIGLNSTIQSLKEPDLSTALTLIGFPGELLVRMLKMLILPLIMSSLIIGLASLDTRASGRLGFRAITYYLSTTVIAVILGMILVSAIKPGKGAEPPKTSLNNEAVRPMDSFLDLVRNVFPDNIVGACFSQGKTEILVIKEKISERNETVDFSTMNATEAKIFNATHDVKSYLNTTTNKMVYYHTVIKYRTYKKGGSTRTEMKPNFLGVIAFSLATGAVLGRLGPTGKTLFDAIFALNEIVLVLVTAVMWYSPIGIWSLIFEKFAAMKDISGTFQSLGLFIATVMTGLIIHGLVLLPLLYTVIVRRNPFVFLKGLIGALLTAFGTSSSAATLPVTFRCLEENNHVDTRVTRFVLPIGATINMDGTALYEGVAAIFIAQAAGFNLSVGDYVSISLTATLASIGAAAVPSAGLVTMLIVLDTAGLPTDYIGVFYSIDWFLDRFRTTINVLGDSIGAGIVHHLSRKELEHLDMVEKREGIDNPLQADIQLTSHV